MSWSPPLDDWQGWSHKYSTFGAYAVGYAQGVEEGAGGPCEVTSSEYAHSSDYAEGYKQGAIDGAAGHVKEPEQLISLAIPADIDERVEEARKEQESDAKQEVMWGDGSVSTKEEHEAAEVRENLDRMTENHVGDEPVELVAE